MTIVSGTFLLHTTKDLDLTAVNLEHILDRKEAAVASSAALSTGTVRERRSAAPMMELGSLEAAKAEASEKGISNGAGTVKDADDEHHPLIGAGGGQVGGSGLSTLGVRKQRGLGGLFG